jgi:putative two-component system response regulator
MDGQEAISSEGASIEGRATVLAVDDTPENLAIIGELLRPLYRLKIAKSGGRALAIARAAPQPDVILLDIMMPGMSGLEVMRQLQADPNTKDIPVIFTTALDGHDDELEGFKHGAVDYITKPISPLILMARVAMHLELKRARDLLKDQKAWLEQEVRRRMAENDRLQVVSVRALAHLAEIRDPETGNHILRTQGYVHELASRIKDHPRFCDVVDERYIQVLTRSVPLHDIGKVGIPDNILMKAGPLSSEEWVVMKTHAALGARAIELAERDVEQPVPFLAVAKEIAHWHHERFDGTGYPDGLVGDAIPLSARIMAVADVFDALITKRVYKASYTVLQARDEIVAGGGSHFDPDLTDAFAAGFDAFVAIAARHQDAAEL